MERIVIFWNKGIKIGLSSDEIQGTTLEEVDIFKLGVKEVSDLISSDIPFLFSNGGNLRGSVLGDGDPLEIVEGKKCGTILGKNIGLVVVWNEVINIGWPDSEMQGNTLWYEDGFSVTRS